MLEVRQLLRSLADEGRTVFVSSHLLSEVQQIADWLVAIKEGRLLFDGPLEQARGGTRTTLLVGAETSDGLVVVATIAERAGFPVRKDRQLLRIEAPGTFAGELNRRAMEQGITLNELHVERATLEETFLSMLEEAPS
jgi:ABC-2 type transport system ATP-binding protein